MHHPFPAAFRAQKALRRLASRVRVGLLHGRRLHEICLYGRIRPPLDPLLGSLIELRVSYICAGGSGLRLPLMQIRTRRL